MAAPRRLASRAVHDATGIVACKLNATREAHVTWQPAATQQCPVAAGCPAAHRGAQAGAWVPPACLDRRYSVSPYVLGSPVLPTPILQALRRSHGPVRATWAVVDPRQSAMHGSPCAVNQCWLACVQLARVPAPVAPPHTHTHKQNPSQCLTHSRVLRSEWSCVTSAHTRMSASIWRLPEGDGPLPLPACTSTCAQAVPVQARVRKCMYVCACWHAWAFAFLSWEGDCRHVQHRRRCMAPSAAPCKVQTATRARGSWCGMTHLSLVDFGKAVPPQRLLPRRSE